MISCGAVDARRSHCQAVQNSAEAKRSACTIDHHGLANPHVDLAQCRVSSPEISESGTLVESYVVRQFDERVLWRSHVFAQAGIGVVAEDRKGILREAEVAVEGVVAAAGERPSAARTASAAVPARVHIDPIARLPGMHLCANLDNFTRRIETENGRQRGAAVPETRWSSSSECCRDSGRFRMPSRAPEHR